MITDTFRRLKMSMPGDDPAEYCPPANREPAVQHLHIYGLSLPFGFDFDNQICVDGSSIRMMVATRALLANEAIELDRRGLQLLTD